MRLARRVSTPERELSDTPRLTARLTESELRAVQMAATGASFATIAAHLNISAGLAKIRIARAYEILGANNAVAAVAEARSRGLI